MKKKCPLNKFKPCQEAECGFWTVNQRFYKEANKTEDASSCALVAIPEVVLEHARATRGVQAATEEFRNEYVSQATRVGTMLDVTTQTIGKTLQVLVASAKNAIDLTAKKEIKDGRKY